MAASASPSTFRYRSVIGAPHAEVFRWHEQPEALAALTPPVLVRIEEQVGGIRDGGRVTLSIGVARARIRCVMRHYGYVAGRRFCDEQVKGPFGLWRHAHVFEPFGPAHTLYEDRIEFAVFRRGSFNRVAAAVLRPVLTVAFAHRHRIVRSRVGGAHRPAASRWAIVSRQAGGLRRWIDRRLVELRATVEGQRGAKNGNRFRSGARQLPGVGQEPRHPAT